MSISCYNCGEPACFPGPPPLCRQCGDKEATPQTEEQLHERELERLSIKVLHLSVKCADAYILLKRCRERFGHLPSTAFDEHLCREIADYLNKIDTETGGIVKKGFE